MNPTDLYQVRLPHWSVGIVADNSDGTYTANYWPELKGGYDLYAMRCLPAQSVFVISPLFTPSSFHTTSLDRIFRPDLCNCASPAA